MSSITMISIKLHTPEYDGKAHRGLYSVSIEILIIF